MHNNNNYVDVQSCVDTVDVAQQGTDQLSSNVIVIVPRSTFSCNGRITGYKVSLNKTTEDNSTVDCGNPRILVWRPLNTQRTRYSIRDDFRLRNSAIRAIGNYYIAAASLSENNRVEFQSGDVIGYLHRVTPCYTVWSNEAAGYTSYSNNDIFSDTINIIDSSVTATANIQPLIQVDFGMTSSYT